MEKLNRRELFAGALVASAAAGVWRTATAAETTGKESETGKRRVRLGGPSFANANDPEDLAQIHRKLDNFAQTAHDYLWHRLFGKHCQ